jgi:hypothetical protein
MRRAEPRRVAADEVLLEARRVLGRDRPFAEWPAARVEAVHDAIGVREAEHLAVARDEPLVDARAECDRRAGRDTAERLERERRGRRDLDARCGRASLLPRQHRARG